MFVLNTLLFNKIFSKDDFNTLMVYKFSRCIKQKPIYRYTNQANINRSKSKENSHHISQNKFQWIATQVL